MKIGKLFGHNSGAQDVIHRSELSKNKKNLSSREFEAEERKRGDGM